MKEEVLSKLFKEEELISLEENIDPNKTPLWKYWEEFVTKYLRTGRSLSTVKNVKDTLKYVIRNLKLLHIEDVNNSRILEEKLFERKDEKGFSNVTYNSFRKNLNTYFIWLEKQSYIEQNNIRKVQTCKEELKEQYTLQENQVKILLGHIKTRRQTRLERWRNELFVSLLVLTGARPCELLQLQIKDIQPHQRGYKLVIHGRKQKGKLRYYQLPSWVIHTYEVYIQTRNSIKRVETNLFSSSSRNTGWTEKGMRKLFSKISKEIGFKITAYSIRRFVATKLNNEGLDLKDIMNYLGHNRPSTTQKYIERSCSLTDKAINLLTCLND